LAKEDWQRKQLKLETWRQIQVDVALTNGGPK